MAAKTGPIDVPFIDTYAKLTVTRFLGGLLQLEVRPSVTDELTLYYYGMGNASSAAPPVGQTKQYFEYGRFHPEIWADVRFRILDTSQAR